MAGFAFETYNEPRQARWEEGADNVRVAYKSEGFARDCYTGILTVSECVVGIRIRVRMRVRVRF